MILTKARSETPRRLLVDEPSDNPLWQMMHRIGDKYYPEIRDLMRNTWDEWRSSLDISRLFDGALARNTVVLLSYIELGWMLAANTMLSAARPILSQAIEETITTSVTAINAQISGSFQIGSMRQIQSWITEHTGEWITQIGETERQAIRNIIYEGITQNRAPAVLARDIQQFIGLNNEQAKFITRRRAAMEEAGIPAARIEIMIENLTEKKIAERAATIARNESIVAVKEGYRTAYQEAAYYGAIPANARRYWIITPVDVCSICIQIPGMNPEGRRLDEPFETPKGLLMTPHAHVTCRCVEEVRI